MHAARIRLTPVPAALALVAALVFGAASYVGRPEAALLAIAAVGVAAALFSRPVLALALAIALMPLEAAGRLVPGVAYLTWSKVALVACSAALLAELLGRRRPLHLPAPVWALFGFVVASLAGSLAGGFGLDSETIENVAGLASSLLLVVLACHYVQTERDFRIASLGVALGSVPVVAVGIVEVVTKEALLPNPMFAERLWAPGATDLFRITSTFYDPNALGRYLVFALLWTVASLGLQSMRPWRVPLAALAAAQAFCLVNTFSRAAFATLVVVAVPFLAARVVRRWGAPGVVAMVATAGVVALALSRSLALLVGRFGDPTAGGRTGIAADAVLAISASPLFGFGREHTSQALGLVWGTPIDPHNLYLETLLAAGAVGLLFAIAWIAPVGRRLIAAWRAGERHAPVVMLPLLGVLFFGVSLHGLDGYELWIPFALALPALELGRRMQEVDACA